MRYESKFPIDFITINDFKWDFRFISELFFEFIYWKSITKLIKKTTFGQILKIIFWKVMLFFHVRNDQVNFDNSCQFQKNTDDYWRENELFWWFCDSKYDSLEIKRRLSNEFWHIFCVFGVDIITELVFQTISAFLCIQWLAK